MNISSNEKGLGGALTNMTELAYRKGNIVFHYPVTLDTVYEDSEQAYQKQKTDSAEYNDKMMIAVIKEKLIQHPKLIAGIDKRGGYEFLLTCSHFTGAKSARFKSWEGVGVESRFIRNLLAGYNATKA